MFIFCNHNLRCSFVLILYLNRFLLPSNSSFPQLSHPVSGLVLSDGRSAGGVAQDLLCDGGVPPGKRQWRRGEGAGKALLQPLSPGGPSLGGSEKIHPGPPPP